jgi:UDP-glucose 4-epimerase
MKAVITGVAGFIGSHLARKLLARGWEITGVDAMTDYYARAEKEEHLKDLFSFKRFTFIKGNILEIEWVNPLKDAEAVFHLAAQPGVRASWGKTFAEYTTNNVLATQVLLHNCVGSKLKKFIYASSSSIYGDAGTLPTPETALPRPTSPYGVTKLAGEHLCYLYWRNFGVPCVSLRYFTVYGPGQRPDMALCKLIASQLNGRAFQIFGDSRQTRDFTYVSDIVNGTVLAWERGAPGEVYNLGGGSRISLNEVLALAAGLTGKKPLVEYRESQKGDVRNTAADISRARRELKYEPMVAIAEGLQQYWQWACERGNGQADILHKEENICSSASAKRFQTSFRKKSINTKKNKL